MRSKKINIESIIEIYLHDHSEGGIKEWVSFKKTDTYPNQKKGLQALVDHHFLWVKALEKKGEFCGRPFAKPDKMIPGKTSNLSADLNVTICYDNGHSREYSLSEPAVLDDSINELNISLSSVSHPPLIFPD